MFYDQIHILNEDTVYNQNGYLILLKLNDNGDIPHVHIVYDNEDHDTCLDLEYNCYGNHKVKPGEGKHRPFPKQSYLRDVLTIMQSPLSLLDQEKYSKKFKRRFNNYWELAKFHWNRSDDRQRKCLVDKCPYNIKTFIPHNR